MTAESSPLQGSLFCDSEEKLLESSSLQNEQNPNNLEINNEVLTKDAQLRPRKRKSKFKINDVSSNRKKSKSAENQPEWSHHTLVEKKELTPVLRHYVELKESNPERILLYRLGDFFECFFEDAILLSQVLELTLTGKDAGKTIGRVPMAGIPHHAADRYCSALIQKGRSIAICDQLENIQNKEGKLIKRGITRILTPGTVLEEGMLHAKKNNWLAAAFVESNQNSKSLKWGLASADISTGEFTVQEGIGINSLEQDLLRIDPSEIICEKLDDELINSFNCKRIKFNERSQTSFSKTEAETTLKKYYKLKTIQGLGFEESKMALCAAGGLLCYLHETNPNTQSKHNHSNVILEIPKVKLSNESLIIDAQTQRNLEIVKTQRDGLFQGSLLWAIDRTYTAMGARCLRRWIENPLINLNEIMARQNIVSWLIKQRQLRKVIRNILRTMGDLERLAGRASAGQAGARELVAIAESLQKLPKLSSNLKDLPTNPPRYFSRLQNIDPKLNKLVYKIKDKLIDSPPISITEGGLIHDGVDLILDGLRNQLDDQDKWLASQELKERKASGNNNLKLQHHRTFGYFLAVSKSKSSEVPSHWIRRQTLANEERFITPDLKAREGQIFQLKNRAANLEYELFSELRELVGNHAQEIRNVAKAVASLDVLSGLAELGASYNYCAPEIINNNDISQSSVIQIEASRHPVVEQMLVEDVFQTNDINLGDTSDLIILTGPNASGKSCYLRQIGLIQILAQIGSWIPAKKAHISIADRIFTRVGAVDDLAAGQSTFMVEMAETAYILNQATKKSLVLLDEIGRGTSTFDGLSIAWSVSEYLAKEIKSRTIFATHYHELNDLSKKMKNVVNFQVLVEQTGEDIYFMHKVVPGGANRSYGIEAARLAGIPKSIINRAKIILNDLEKENNY